MRIVVVFAALLLAAFAPPERGLRYVFQIDDAARQAKTVEVMRARAEAAGLDAVVLPVEADRIEVRVPYDVEHAKFVRMMTWPGVLTFNLVDTAANAADYPVREVRNGRIRLETLSPNAMQPVIYMDAILTRSDIANTRTMTDQLGHPAIVLDLKPEGAAIFARVTTMNVGRMFAVVIDDRIISAPVVQTPIRGGSLTITGAFSREEAEGLAVVLRTEMLPTIPRLVETGTFGEAQ
jgi:protein-export membrane protein SecD